MSKLFAIKQDFTLMAILLIPIAVAVNFVGGSLALALKLPLYLDSIGTFIVAMLAGPWVGGVTGFLSLLGVSITDPTSLPWAVLAALVGVVVGTLARGKMFLTWGRIISSIGIIVLVSVALVVIMRFLFFGGFTTSGSSLVAAAMMTAGMPFWFAQVLSSIVSEIPDKTITVLIAVFVIRSISTRTLLKFGTGSIFAEYRTARKAKKKAAATPVAAGTTN
ncbi:ECF transporter S component [Mycetocola tolaasinivorans]|uniref:ECF transporter S component n=1 Tax=Mycetocola tolaasinivorans TaxID=76635 RepID=A0A3L7A341_9MICO|nr:ECF transporter S component [Mycetocola tolaasinivorans]RLP74504.1 ECF transporter S component [Mycetocola tolaasinivorans]